MQDIEDAIMAGVPPGMPAMTAMTASEWLLLSLNPFPILVRSRLECGLEGRGYVAALTDRFEQAKSSSLPHEINGGRTSLFRKCREPTCRY